MAETVFFSWQLDRSARTGRNFLERVLERVVARVSSRTHLEDADRGEISLDRDTRGVPGQPPIVETIFRKIDNAAVFVPDLTFVGSRVDGRPTPNPNVLIEYGWALKSLGHGRIVPVMNIAHGRPDGNSMPFDMRHLRHPIQYDLPDGASEEAAREARENLTRDLEIALRTVLESEELRPSRKEPEKFTPRAPIESTPSRFRLPGLPIGMSASGVIGSKQIKEWMLTPGPAIWLRVMPVNSPGRSWSARDLRKSATQSGIYLSQLHSGYRDLDYVQSDDGFGIIPVWRDGNGTPAVAFAFLTGEVWSIDTYLINAVLANTKEGRQPMLPLQEDEFKRALLSYSQFLERLGISRPHRWIAGMEGVKGMGLALGRGIFPAGACVSNDITAEGLFEVGADPNDALRPFFELVFDRFGLDRPSNLENAPSD